jgi:hypothetical protein
MNEFRLQTAVHMMDGYLSTHPAQEHLLELITKYDDRTQRWADDDVYDTCEVISTNIQLKGENDYDGDNDIDEEQEDGYDVHSLNVDKINVEGVEEYL